MVDLMGAVLMGLIVVSASGQMSDLDSDRATMVCFGFLLACMIYVFCAIMIPQNR